MFGKETGCKKVTADRLRARCLGFGRVPIPCPAVAGAGLSIEESMNTQIASSARKGSKRKKHPLLFLGVNLFVMFCAGVQAAPPGEYEVKAAFVHNIAKFVEWPASVGARGILRLCVLGQGAFGEAAGGLRGKPVGGMVWEVAPVAAGANLSECQVLFIEASEARDLPRLLDSLKDGHVLTVGDTAGYGQQGVMVNLYLEQNKVRFEINLAAARHPGLKISSHLLKLARIVQATGGEQ